MADYIGSSHRNIVLEPPQVAFALYPAAETRDLPSMADMNSSLLLFCKAVREAVTVAVSSECAEMVLDAGTKLTTVEMNSTIGLGIYNVVFNDIMSRTSPHSPEVLTGRQLTAVTDSSVAVKDLVTGEAKVLTADTVILALGTRSQPDILEAYESTGLNTVLVGNAEVPGRIAGAVCGGFEKAWVFNTK